MIHYLNKHGYTWDSIKTYTLSEIGVFIRECYKDDKKQRDEDILTYWTACNADYKYIKNNILKNFKPPTPSSKEIENEWKRLANFNNLINK